MTVKSVTSFVLVSHPIAFLRIHVFPKKHKFHSSRRPQKQKHPNERSRSMQKSGTNRKEIENDCLEENLILTRLT